MLNKDELDTLERMVDRAGNKWLLAQFLKKMPDFLSCLVLCLIIFIVLFICSVPLIVTIFS